MIRITSLLLLWALSTAGFADDAILIKGSTSALPLMQQIVRLYRSEYPDANLQVEGGGSGAGLAALIDGQVDIAMSSRFIDPLEVQLAVQQGIYPVPLQIAHDAIVPVVHPSNPLRNLSLQQLTDIYRGYEVKWSGLGGPAAPISTVCRDWDSGTRTTWRDLALDGTPARSCGSVAPSNRAVLEKVRSDPNAIGYVSLAFISANSGVRPLRVEKQACTPRCVKTGCYPLTRPLFLFTNGWPDQRLMRFIDFALHSEQARKVIRRAGLIPAQ